MFLLDSVLWLLLQGVLIHGNTLSSRDELCAVPDTSGKVLQTTTAPKGVTQCATKCFTNDACKAYVYSDGSCELLSSSLAVTPCDTGAVATYGSYLRPGLITPSELSVLAVTCRQGQVAGTGGGHYDFRDVFVDSQQAPITRIRVYYGNAWLTGIQMEFGGPEFSALAGGDINTMGECVFAPWELITSVTIEAYPWNDGPAAVAVTFVTSSQSCRHGARSGTSQTIASGGRLLYSVGMVGALFDALEFVFQSC